MDPSTDAVVVSQGPLARMRELERVLGKLSLHVAVLPPPGGSSGWTPTFLLAVASEESELAKQAIDEHWKQNLDDGARASADATIDVEAETWTCPACTSTFPQGSLRCPSCGLRLG